MTKSIDQQMTELIRSDEWEPPANSKDWITKNGIRMMTKFSNPVEYQIDKSFVHSIQKYNNLFLKNETYKRPQPETNYGKVYSVTDNKTGRTIVSHTSLTVLYAIKIGLMQYFRNGKSLFDEFDVNIIDTTFTAKLLEVVDSKDNKLLKNEQDYYRAEVSKKTVPESTELDKYNKWLAIFEQKLSPYKNRFGKIPGYVYKLTNTQNGKSFIGISFDKITATSKTKTRLVNELLGSNSEFKDDYTESKLSLDDINMVIFGKTTWPIKQDVLMNADRYIIEGNTIKKGYNLDYYLYDGFKQDDPKTHKKLFAMIQMELFKKEFQDTNDYTDVTDIIFMLKSVVDVDSVSEEKTYVGAYKRTQPDEKMLESAILKLYDAAIRQTKKFNKIGNALSQLAIDNWKYSILRKKKIKQHWDIDKKTEELIKSKHGDDGYNERVSAETRQKWAKAYMKKKLNDQSITC